MVIPETVIRESALKFTGKNVVENMLCTEIVLNVKTKTKKTIFVHKMF